jgi:hypothetical protein
VGRGGGSEPERGVRGEPARERGAWGGEEGVGWWDPMAIAGNLLLFAMGSASFG